MREDSRVAGRRRATAPVGRLDRDARSRPTDDGPGERGARRSGPSRARGKNQFGSSRPAAGGGRVERAGGTGESCVDRRVPPGAVRLRTGAGALASIRRDELRAFRAKSSTRSVWVVPALTTHLLPARGYLALSSWPAWLRIHGTRSARVDTLRILLVLLDTLAGLPAAGSDRLTGCAGTATYPADRPAGSAGRRRARHRPDRRSRVGPRGDPGRTGRTRPKDRAERDDAAALTLSTVE